MKLFALKDAADGDNATLAVLSCYDGLQREYYIDMPEGTDPWTVPFILSSFAKRGQWTIGPEWSRRWVESRIAPPSRQNIGEILKVNGLDAYDDLALLEETGARNSQDSCYLEPMREAAVPAWFAEREATRVVEAIALAGRRLLVAFRMGEVRVCDGERLLAKDKGARRVLEDAAIFNRVQVASGGRGVRWGSFVRVSDESLGAAGVALPLSWDDLSRIAPEMLVDAAEAAEMLQCTRQNVNALAKRGGLAVAKSSGRATLFLRADVRARADA